VKRRRGSEPYTCIHHGRGSKLHQRPQQGMGQCKDHQGTDVARVIYFVDETAQDPMICQLQVHATVL
jgi:hypothetical protein